MNNFRYILRNDTKILGTYGNPRFRAVPLPEEFRNKNLKVLPEFVSVYVKDTDLSGKKDNYILLNLRNAIFYNNYKNEDKNAISSSNIAIIPKGTSTVSNYSNFQFTQNNQSFNGAIINGRNFNFDNLELDFVDSEGNTIPEPSALGTQYKNYIVVLNFIIME